MTVEHLGDFVVC